MLSTKKTIKTKNRRVRIYYNRAQKNYLEYEFQNNRYIGNSHMAHIAEELGVSELRVRIWFQNRRRKHKVDELLGIKNNCPNYDNSSQGPAASLTPVVQENSQPVPELANLQFPCDSKNFGSNPIPNTQPENQTLLYAVDFPAQDDFSSTDSNASSPYTHLLQAVPLELSTSQLQYLAQAGNETVAKGFTGISSEAQQIYSDLECSSDAPNSDDLTVLTTNTPPIEYNPTYSAAHVNSFAPQVGNEFKETGGSSEYPTYPATYDAPFDPSFSQFENGMSSAELDNLIGPWIHSDSLDMLNLMDLSLLNFEEPNQQNLAL